MSSSKLWAHRVGIKCGRSDTTNTHIPSATCQVPFTCIHVEQHQNICSSPCFAVVHSSWNQMSFIDQRGFWADLLLKFRVYLPFLDGLAVELEFVPDSLSFSMTESASLSLSRLFWLFCLLFLVIGSIPVPSNKRAMNASPSRRM